MTTLSLFFSALRAPGALDRAIRPVGAPRLPPTASAAGRGSAIGLLLAGLLAATGCSIPIPQAEADPTRFYVLSADSGLGVAAAAGAPVVYLREVDVATYLRAQPIIVRRDGHEIEFREYARWGEPIERGIGRVLREELVARGVPSAVLTPGLRLPGVNYDRELKVRVLAAEGTASGGVNFRARWELTTVGATPERVAGGEFRAADLGWDGQNEDALVARLSEAIAGLAGEIAAALPAK